MRNFRFRLDPVMRLKEYKIQQVEDEMSRIEQEIQRLLRENEAGRVAVQNLRRHIMEEVQDHNLVQSELQLVLFTEFSVKEELRRDGEIAKHKEEKELKHQELIKLYQEQKALERLKERRKTEWETEMRKEESAIMDEIGTQKYVRRDNEFGGVILYLLVPIVLVGAIAAAGIYTGVIDQEMLNKLPFFGATPQSATATIQSVTGPLEEDYLTLEQMIGDPDTPMPELLKNIAAIKTQLDKKSQSLAERERLLAEQEARIGNMQNMLAGETKRASDYLMAYQDLKRQLEESKTSELSQYEVDLAKTLSSAKGKELAGILSELYGKPNVLDNLRTQERALLINEPIIIKELADLKQKLQTGQATPAEVAAKEDEIAASKLELEDLQEQIKKIRDSQLLLLRILHRFQPRGQKDLFVALGKSDPQTAAQIIADFATTDSFELNNIQPTPTPLPTAADDGIGSGTGPLGSG